MTRVAFFTGVMFLVAACGVGVSPSAAPSPSPAPVASPTPVATATLQPTPEPTPTLVPGDGLCPTAAVLDVLRFTEADPACFGGAELTIRGWLDVPPGLGFEGPLIKPEWVAYPADGLPTLWTGRPVEPDHICPAAPLPCAWFFLHLNPASGINLRIAKPREIVVTGHLDDPAAMTCHYTYDDNWEGDHLDDANAVAMCRGQFIVDSFVDAP